MTALDVSALLEPIADDAPSGAAIEYDERYIELERLARGVAQEEDAEGKIIREAEPPDWSEVERIAIELAQAAKDLRVAIYLARARLAIDGLPGLKEALELIAGYLSRYWDSFHPQLDAADDNDPSIRLNTLISLCDSTTMLRELRAAPLTQSRRFGRLSYRDFAIASGLLSPPPTARSTDEKPPDAARIDDAFADTDIGVLTATQEAAAAALEALQSIDASLDETLGSGNGLDFTPLEKLLTEIKGLLDNQVAKRGGGEGDGADGDGEMAGEGAGGPVSAGRGPITGAVRSREDVLMMIDKICRYYADHEPSSPVPLILNRTKRLVTMSFLDILKELTPGGVQEFGVIAGIKEEESE
jgi:type VI secretion system protein ImpA